MSEHVHTLYTKDTLKYKINYKTTYAYWTIIIKTYLNEYLNFEVKDQPELDIYICAQTWGQLQIQIPH